MTDKFNWHGSEDQEAVVIESVQAIAVYTNPKGAVVIRQESSMREDDHFIVIPRSMVSKLAKALRDEIKKPFTPDED